MIELGTIAGIIGIFTFLIGLITVAFKIFSYIGAISGEIATLQNVMQRDLIKIAEDNAEFRLTAQREISELALRIEREFLRKT